MSTKKATTFSPCNENLIQTAKPEEKQKVYLSNLIDNININNNANSFYKEDSLFKKRLEKLNYKFYTETEKYLNNKLEVESSQDQLFVILFKQISLYMEENERLNQLLKEKSDTDKHFNKDDVSLIISQFHKKERDKLATQQTINYLKASNINLEKKISEKTKAEEKIKAENESLKRQLKFYKDKLQLEVNVKKTIQTVAKRTNKNPSLTINYEDNQKTNNLKESFVRTVDNKTVKNVVKSTVANESGKINYLEITVNKLKNDDDKLSESSKKGRKSILSEDIEDNQDEKENTKRSMASRNVQSHSPNNNLGLNFSTALTSKNKQANFLKFSKQVKRNLFQKPDQEVKGCSSTQNKSTEPSKEKSNEYSKSNNN